MARKKRSEREKTDLSKIDAVIAGAGVVEEQAITETLRMNYMPYAMSVILSRAIPEIDGFKPSHRKLLYTMYDMGLLTKPRTKSANIVGQTMRLNPHGDAAIYDTMVRLSRGYEALLHPYVDSKGNFGKAYSRDMAWAASRYTEAKLDPLANELFRDIKKDTVDFVPNYDNSTTEPTLLPVTFPSVLVNANTGIAVGMASSICPFNLAEVCETAIACMRDDSHDILSTLAAPDFPGGGLIVYDRAALEQIYATGRGSIKVRSVYDYDKSNNCIDITEIPPTTTVESIIEKVTELVKSGKVREIADIRDETGLDGLKITIDLKRGTDADKLMQKLFKMTTLQDSFSCNFNILIAGTPRVMGVREILNEWTAFRVECVRRRVYFDLVKCREKLHLLEGLAKILLDIDKAIRIVRETEEEAEVVPNLMIGFGIDEIQAEYVAEIKLRHLNREYILKRTDETDSLRRQIEEMDAVLKSGAKVRDIIIKELREVVQKYGKPRRSRLYYPQAEENENTVEEAPDYAVNLFFTEQGYFKKITPQSLRMSGEQKLKEGDRIICRVESNNNNELLFFTDKQQVYKAKVSDFDDTKASVLGDYIPAKLKMDEGESVLYMAVAGDYSGYMLFFFDDGKVAKIDMSAYATKTNRRKLIGAYSDKTPVAAIYRAYFDGEYLMKSTNTRMLLFNSAAISAKSTRTSGGVAVMTQKKNQRVESVEPYNEGDLARPHRFRTKSLPAAGSLPQAEDLGEQLKL